MNASPNRSRTAKQGAPDRQEIARDLFREHLDIDRIGRLIHASRPTADAGTDGADAPPASARQGPVTWPRLSTVAPSSRAATEPTVHRTPPDHIRPKTTSMAGSNRFGYRTPLRLVAVVLLAGFAATGLDNGGQTFEPVGQTFSPIDSGPPSLPKSPPVTAENIPTPGMVQPAAVRIGGTQSPQPATPALAPPGRVMVEGPEAFRPPAQAADHAQRLPSAPRLVRSVFLVDGPPMMEDLQAAHFDTPEPVPEPVSPRRPAAMQLPDTPPTIQGMNPTQKLPPAVIADFSAPPQTIRSPAAPDAPTQGPDHALVASQALLTGNPKPPANADAAFREVAATAPTERPRARPATGERLPVSVQANGTTAPRLVIHYSGGAGKRRADTLALQLGEQHIGRVQLRAVDLTVARDNVRYFFLSDRTVAGRVGNIMLESARPPAIRDFSSFRPSPSRGTIEIWLSS